MTSTETGLLLDLPPGFIGMPVTADDETNAGIAKALGQKVAEATGTDAGEFSAHLRSLTPYFKENGVRLFGRFAVGEGPEHVATLALGTVRLPSVRTGPAEPDGEVMTSALLNVYRRNHPRADVRAVRLPLGPALAAIEVGEFRLPPELTGRADDLVQPRIKAEFQVPLPTGEGVVILAVTADSMEAWPAVAEAASRVAHSLRPGTTEE
ncbi:hypothetical protein SAMN04489729_5864 [Amycolatopsis lurida]|uniref:Uncharacterized protein n=1 Tax=Amycolatopsis lurida NRRL 2430 TaxID=1460371 RepID=A0A2P2FXZ9_AMYLU|nr:hypothetical protein [Amycolatopsis lurida]KFU81593.1 hypothetical protein BB31_09490 [Amycolatopsis lurida NRRL 2430]SED95701.1 hypothetical protein SAMN04489729_5864 [Amycolatopsis lurida]